MNNAETNFSPDALMLLSSHCALCPGVLDSLTKMIKNGDIGNLSVINLDQHPEAMQQYNTRTVPWVRIGKYELTGAQTLEALQQRAQWAIEEQNSGVNQVAGFDFLLSEGQASKVVEAIQNDASAIRAVMTLLADPGTVLSTRIGIGVVFEELAGSDLLKTLIEDLGALTKHKDQRIRADAYHYLGMTADKNAVVFLEAGKTDKDKEVQEIAADSLKEINNQLTSLK